MAILDWFKGKSFLLKILGGMAVGLLLAVFFIHPDCYAPPVQHVLWIGSTLLGGLAAAFLALNDWLVERKKKKAREDTDRILKGERNG